MEVQKGPYKIPQEATNRTGLDGVRWGLPKDPVDSNCVPAVCALSNGFHGNPMASVGVIFRPSGGGQTPGDQWHTVDLERPMRPRRKVNVNGAGPTSQTTIALTKVPRRSLVYTQSFVLFMGNPAGIHQALP